MSTRIQPGSTRRMFLRGTGGALLAIPLLESLLPRGARAGTAGVPRRFAAFSTGHGGIRGANMFPDGATLTSSQQYAGHTIRRGALTLSVDGGVARLSPVLSASSSVLTAALAGKLNVLRGLDAGFYVAHTRGIHLGNLAGHDESLAPVSERRPTIDQVLAYSDKFYPQVPAVRSINLGPEYSISVGRENPFDPASPLQDIPTMRRSLDLFGQIYMAPDPDHVQRPPVVDRVLADYKRVRDGARISAQDRTRLDAHIARLDDFQAKLAAVQSCEDVQPPTQEAEGVINGAPNWGTDPSAQALYWQLFNEVVAIAFSCDTCRIATFAADALRDYSGPDYHQDVAHRADRDAPTEPPEDPLSQVWAQDLVRDGHQRFFEQVYLDFVAKLDAIDDGTGGTLLDSSLVAWTQESGIYTHDAIDWGVVLAGGAAGNIATGSFCDYRNTAVSGNQYGQAYPGPYPMYPNDTTPEYSWFGLMLPQYYGTLLQAMGLSPEDYEETSYGGYGPMHVDPDYAQHSAGVLAAAHEMLPFL
ncbi:MAG: DUF1552 domain-containing protein [Deltaproteobacteria bacterium]|nr:DUF1552 domain-containing protein [Deltaproteobacteria bacterium]MBK8714822.1 DUF1552 domain-containing protein [Deltaproteobacteria bacterium]